MADKLDRIIGDYLTGRLAANIKARELDLRARKPKDNLGIRTQSLGIAPQEIEYLRVEEDELKGVLGKMKKCHVIPRSYCLKSVPFSNF